MAAVIVKLRAGADSPPRVLQAREMGSQPASGDHRRDAATARKEYGQTPSGIAIRPSRGTP